MDSSALFYDILKDNNYHNILVYFKRFKNSLTIDDISRHDMNNFLDVFTEKDKYDASIIYTRIIEPYKKNKLANQTRYLDFSSNRVTHVKNRYNSMKNVMETINNTEETDKFYFDFTKNQIMDDDFNFFKFFFFNNFEKRIKKPCIINFSQTCISGWKETLISIIKLIESDKVLYLTIHGTKIFHNNPKFFENLTDKQIEKLIWIDYNSINHELWFRKLKPQQIQKIRGVHKQYYEKYY